jgi:hypothetical protein
MLKIAKLKFLKMRERIEQWVPLLVSVCLVLIYFVY